jgi:hypothetical protein
MLAQLAAGVKRSGDAGTYTLFGSRISSSGGSP